MERRSLLALAAPLIVAGLSNAAAAQTTTDGGDANLDRSGFRQFMALPGKKSYLVEVSPPGTPWRMQHLAHAQMFIGSAVKTFILATFLRFAEQGRLHESDQLTIDDGIRSLDSPIFEKLSGTASARTVLEAMISHSDNTATDAALALVGVRNVRRFIATAGLTATVIPESTRILLSYLAGAPPGVDEGWEGMEKIAAGHFFGPPRQPINDRETMLSTAAELVSYYRRVLKGRFFDQPDTLTEFQRIQATADAIARVVPPDIKAYAKGGSIDWQDFHAICVPGQMIVDSIPVTFCFTVNWTGPDSEVPAVAAAYRAAVAAILSSVAKKAS